jgi:hypothetical protein
MCTAAGRLGANGAALPAPEHKRRWAEAAYGWCCWRVCGRSGKTGFEESKDFPIRLGSVVAGRYQLMEYLGSAAFSKAVQALDLHTGLMVCIKIIKNNKDFFDQVRLVSLISTLSH